MMRKNLVNKKVVSSIGIGIMALVTATSPTLTVLADNEMEPELDLVVESNTSNSENQEQTEQAASDNQAVTDNLSSAQTEVNDAQEAVKDADVPDNIGDALNNAQNALGEISKDVEELNELNTAVEESQKDETGIVQDKVDTVNDSSNGVIESVDGLTEENVKEVENTADVAEDASKKEYDNASSAQEAESQVKDTIDDATAEDGLFGKVEQAEKDFNSQEVSDAINTVTDQIDRIEAAQENAAGKANDIKQDAEGVGELTDAVQAAESTQTGLQNVLDKAETLKDQIVTELKNNEDTEELIELVNQIPDLGKLNKFEMENYIASIMEFKDVKLGSGDEATTVFALVESYIKDYQAALKDHADALKDLATGIENLELNEGNAKDALDNAMDAFEKAAEYEKECLDACGEVNKIITAINGVEKAQDELDSAKNEVYEEIFNSVADKDGNGFSANAEEAYKKWEEEKDPKEKVKKWTAYIESLNSSAEARIKYLLLKDNIVKSTEDIEIVEWYSDADKDNYTSNYVKVSYKIYDEEGNFVRIQEEYFDYTHTKGSTGVDVVRKNPIYESEKGDSLKIQVNNGVPTYELNGVEVEGDRVHVTEGGGYIIDDAIKTEKYYFENVAGMIGNSKVEVITEYGKEPKYTCYGPLGVVRPEWKPIIKDGIVIGISLGAIEYKDLPEGETYNNTMSSMAVGNEAKFTDKGDVDRGLSDEDYQKDVENYRDIINGLETALGKAKEELGSSVSGRDENDAVKAVVDGYLSDGKELANVLGEAEQENKKVTESWKTANQVKVNVDKAYLGIAGAVASLLDVSAKTAETDYYKNLKDTKKNYAIANEKLKDEKVGRLKAAVETLKNISFPFDYATPGTTPGGTTGGGTTGGGTTGGGTTGGGTGGTTGGGAGGAGGGAADAGAPVPVAAPVVNIPTAAVPLAGPTVADAGDAQENGAEGLTTLEDEVTPLAGPEEMASEVNMEDFPIPLVGPVAEMGQMSWWWLLLIAVLGVTGEEMYRRHQKKQRGQANIEN